MARTKMKLKTARPTTKVSALIMVVLTTVLAVAEFMGWQPTRAFTWLEAVAFLGAGIVLLIEVFMEGERTGLKGRRPSEYVGMVVAIGALIMGVGAVLGSVAGVAFIALPNWLQGFVILMLPVNVAWELMTE